MKLRWKLAPKQTGLSVIGAGPRRSILHDGEKEYASIFPINGSWRGPVTGWAWAVQSQGNIPHHNTAGNPCETVEEAKEQAKEFVLKHLENSDETKG